MIAIDPGVQACGVAWFSRKGELERAEYVHVSSIGALCSPFEKLIIEMPRIYPGSGQRKGDLNDLLDLAAVVGRCEQRLGPLASRRVFPAQWKGQVPKKIMNARVLGKLSPDEQDRIKRAGAKTHNVLDAIGIGLWALGRL